MSTDILSGISAAIFEGYGPPAAVSRYLPSNYRVIETPVGALVWGIDRAGYTWDGYIVPRLASGLYFRVSGLFVEPVEIDHPTYRLTVTDEDDVFGPPVFETAITIEEK